MGQAECARFIVDRNVPLKKLLTHRFKLDEADQAYRLFDTQTTGAAFTIGGPCCPGCEAAMTPPGAAQFLAATPTAEGANLKQMGLFQLPIQPMAREVRSRMVLTRVHGVLSAHSRVSVGRSERVPQPALLPVGGQVPARVIRRRSAPFIAAQAAVHARATFSRS
jgi:hypothetical protein